MFLFDYNNPSLPAGILIFLSDTSAEHINDIFRKQFIINPCINVQDLCSVKGGLPVSMSQDKISDTCHLIFALRVYRLSPLLFINYFRLPDHTPA